MWRAEVVLATADGLGTNAILRLTGKSKPCVWRWQKRHMDEGVEGLQRDKTRPSRKQLLARRRSLRCSEDDDEEASQRDALEAERQIGHLAGFVGGCRST